MNQSALSYQAVQVAIDAGEFDALDNAGLAEIADSRVRPDRVTMLPMRHVQVGFEAIHHQILQIFENGLQEG